MLKEALQVLTHYGFWGSFFCLVREQISKQREMSEGARRARAIEKERKKIYNESEKVVLLGRFYNALQLLIS